MGRRRRRRQAAAAASRKWNIRPIAAGIRSGIDCWAPERRWGGRQRHTLLSAQHSWLVAVAAASHGARLGVCPGAPESPLSPAARGGPSKSAASAQVCAAAATVEAWGGGGFERAGARGQGAAAKRPGQVGERSCVLQQMHAGGAACTARLLAAGDASALGLRTCQLAINPTDHCTQQASTIPNAPLCLPLLPCAPPAHAFGWRQQPRPGLPPLLSA